MHQNRSEAGLQSASRPRMWKGIGIGTVRKGEEGNVKTESRNRESGEKRVIGRKGWKWQEIRVELTPQSFLTVGV